MESPITGIVIIKTENFGSKSEADYAYLQTSDGKRYRMYRPEMNDANDEFFLPFSNKKVAIVGEVEEKNYIAVSKIQILNNVEIIEEDKNEKIL